MSNRISSAQLQSIVDRINHMTNSPMRPHDIDDATGKYVAQVGCYHLSQAYGGYALHRMCNESGGIVDVLGRGHMPKRELSDLLHAWMQGYETAKELFPNKVTPEDDDDMDDMLNGTYTR